MKVLQQYVIGFIFLISCLLSAGNAPAADEDKIAGVLTAGETGYEIPVKVVNNNREPMQDVTVAIEDYPAGLVNFRVTPRPDSPISPGKSFVFLVSFDVAEDAKANDKAKIILSVTAPGVVFDNPSPQLTVTIEEKSEVSRTSTILRLVEIAEVPEHITSAWEGQHESGASGVSLRMEEKQILDYICPKGVTWGGCNGQKQEWQDFRTWQKKISSLKIMDFPLEIEPEEPFQFSAEWKMEHDYSDHSFPHNPGLKCREMYFLRISASGMGVQSEVPQAQTHLHGDPRALCDHRGINMGSGAVSGSPCRTKATGKSAKLGVTARFMPLPTETVAETARRFSYEIEPVAGTTIAGASEAVLFVGQLNPGNNSYDSLSELVVSIVIGPEPSRKILLRYKPVPVEKGLTPTPYEHPESILSGDDDEETGSGTEAVESSSGMGTGASNPGTGTTGPVDQDSIDPNDPEVTAHIHQWITVAEPPENAVPGNNWRYDRFGRMVGNGSTIQTLQSGTHETVDYGSGTSEQKAWSLRKKLDSINHCTLEEYVVAQLSSESIQHCRGRYGAVSDLKGVKLAEAKAVLAGKGFQYALAPGMPAKSNRESGTVEKQEPGPDQHLKKGATVTLYVHSPYFPQAYTLPDFTSRPLKEAKEWLADNGLSTTLKPGDPAPKAALSGAVQKQEPGPGTIIKTGGSVSLTVYSKYVDIRKVPDVTGLTIDDARQRLAEAGLALETQEAGRPPSRNMARTVQKQSPRAATKVARGQKVQVWFYSRYVQTREEQVAAHDCSAVELSRAYWDNDANAPRCGCFDGLKLNRNKTACVAESVANSEICSNEFPGSIARGYTSAGKINCTCPSGLKWNSGRTKCLDENIVNNKTCAREFPGSIARGYTNAGKINCTCPSGLKWNAGGTRCIDEDIVNNKICARDFPGSIARGYTNAGKINCTCPSGYVWNGSRTGCVRETEQRNCTLRDLSEGGGLCHDYSKWRKGPMVDTLVNVIVVSARKVRNGWKPPAGYRHGRLQECSVLLKEAREKCGP